MQVSSKVIAGLVTCTAAVAAFAAPAAAAPVTVQTDAGTRCTIEAGKTVGGGLVLRPITFTGTVDCTLADSANAPVANSGLVLTSTAPLGLGGAGGTPTTPADQEAVPGFPGKQGPGFKCVVEPGADCDFAGRSNGLPLGSYDVIFGSGLTAPEGETWTVVTGKTGLNQGCTLEEGGRAVACASSTGLFAAR